VDKPYFRSGRGAPIHAHRPERPIPGKAFERTDMVEMSMVCPKANCESGGVKGSIISIHIGKWISSQVEANCESRAFDPIEFRVPSGPARTRKNARKAVEAAACQQQTEERYAMSLWPAGGADSGAKGAAGTVRSAGGGRFLRASEPDRVQSGHPRRRRPDARGPVGRRGGAHSARTRPADCYGVRTQIGEPRY
jgi:hypothetical protein